MMAISKIVMFGLETRVVELKNQQKSNREIARILTEESSESIAKDSVNQYFKTHYKILKRLAKEDAKFHKEMLRQFLDANEILLFVAREARAAVEEAKANSESPSRRAALLSVLLHQAEILLKRSGEISDAPQVMIINQEFKKFQNSVLTIIEKEGGEELCERILRRIQKETR